ncbi:MAG: dihydrolipoamide acetyltransferase family protein, partial [Acidimicrobiaceae bacterium]|nr:dihydrolipoamide acetyltransferase family protein [Acidimicrobiaceae bacterium]
GEIVEWLVALGDTVELDQPICSVETDKSVVEMTTPYRATVLALGGEPGDVIEVGETLIVVGEPGEEIPAPGSGPGASAAATIQPVAAAPAATAVAAADTVRAVPKARKLARERGIDLTAVTGTGPGGSITVADVEAATASAAGSERRERLSATRRSIARHMTRSMQVPQFTSMVDADASGLLEARAAVAAETGSRVPLDALLVALLVPVLRDHPVMNARLDSDEIEYFDRYDIGVAVDTAEGLMVPVVRAADTLGVPELSAEILRLAAAARDRTAAPHELAGATATVNNVGALGVLAGTPMLPVGTSMIAAFGMARPVVRLVDGVPVEVPTITVSATFDHRIIDGGASGRFLAQLKKAIETATPHHQGSVDVVLDVLGRHLHPDVKHPESSGELRAK